MFIVALFIIAKTCEKPKCPSTAEWIKKMWYIDIDIYIWIYKMEYYSAIKEWNNAICSNINGPRDYYTEWSKSDKDKYHMISLNMWNLIKMTQKNLFIKQKQTQISKPDLGLL